MPTLQSIGLHPQLREKLVSLEPSIETPQALLSRDPASLAHTIGVPLSVIDGVRGAVADALIASTRDGKRAWRVTAAVNGEASSQEKQTLVVGAVSALEYAAYQEQACRRPCLETGSVKLDRLLSLNEKTSQQDPAGLAFGYVTQVTGPPSCGKTQLALSLAARHGGHGGSVVYLASGFGHGSLSPLVRRLYHLCNRANYKQVLSNVVFSPVSNGYQVVAELDKLEDKLISSLEKDNTLKQGLLIVLDSASGCLAADLYAAGDGDAGKMIAHQVAMQLKTLVRNYPVAVLVTNGTVSAGEHGGVKAAMGQAWRCGDVSVRFDLFPQSADESKIKVIRAQLEKHPMHACHGNDPDNTIELAITDGGIADIQLNYV